MPRGVKSELGSRTKRQNGYWVQSTEEGDVYVHWLTAWQKYGRKHDPATERIRIIDGDKENVDDPDNIEIVALGVVAAQKREQKQEAKDNPPPSEEEFRTQVLDLLGRIVAKLEG